MKHERRSGVAGTYVTAYVYEDEAGNRLYRKVRCKTNDSKYPKYFYFEKWEDNVWRGKRTPDENILEGVRIVPFRLPTFAEKSSVLLLEGEKDCLNVAKLGYVTTTSPFGHNNWPVEITPCFKDKLVFILYDVDHYGGRWPEKIATMLYGTAREIRICRFPNEASLPHEYDISDYLAAVPSGPAQRRDQVTRIRELLR